MEVVMRDIYVRWCSYIDVELFDFVKEFSKSFRRRVVFV